MTMMSNEEEKRCPICTEEMDWTDQQFKPCKCGYQVCIWCWHHIMDIAEKDASEGRCPACRTKYEKDEVVAMQANFERAGNNNANQKSKPPKAKPKANEVRKDLTNVRVIQRKMAYVTGLPLSIADEDLLQRKEYFGKYGKISKVSLSRTAGGSIQLFMNDAFSVYITYSKEEEAIQCIQSVHGFVLEGMYLRASFGTAKYCHAWLRNTPCSNPSCLYLHSLGADEDSFGKDEAAAIHTRSRVQQIVGASSSAMKRSGNVLPPPVNEIPSTIFTSTENSTIQSAGATSDIVNHSSYMAHVVPYGDKDEGAGDPNRMSTFVDVGLSNSSGVEKDRNSSEDSRILDLCSNLSSVTINKDKHAQEPYSDTLLFEAPSSNHLVSHLPRDQNSIEISVEPFREDSISFDGQRSKDSNSICQREFLMSSHSVNCTGDSGGYSLMHRTCSRSNNGMEHRSLHNEAEEASPPLSCVNSTLIDGLHDLKFQSSVKSDTIYRGSNSFSNEEIVEHLRRTENDCLNNYDSAFSPVKNSIISNILAMDFGSRDDSLTLRHSLTGLCNEPNGQRDSWKSLHSGQGFSFMKQDGSSSQRADLDSSSSNISLMSKQSSILQDFRERKEQHMLESQYQISRPKGMAPPGFSISSSRVLPPGFPLSGEIGGFPCALSGSQLVNSSSSSLIHPPSVRSTSSAGDTDFVDPAILSCGKGKQTNGFSISGLEIGSQRRALEDEARLWLLMQRKYADQDGKFSRDLASQTPSAYQEQRFHGADEYAGMNNVYGFSPRLMDQRQHFDQSLHTHFPQKFANGPISNGYQHDILGNFQCRNDVDRMAEFQRNERLGFDKYYTWYENQTS